MRLVEFRVTNYRCILDSGWVQVGDIAVIVGKNESGKTSLLRALQKFKPFKSDPYNMDREWPRGHRKERNKDTVVIACRFEFTAEELEQLKSLEVGGQMPSHVEITKTYAGQYSSFTFLHKESETPISLKPRAKAEEKAVEKITAWIPTFIYMDEYKSFRGTAFLNQLKERKDGNRLSDEDRTVIMLMEMAQLDLEQEVKRAQQEDKEQRILDMNDASLTLSREIADRWKQKKYEVLFSADGQHFITFVKGVEDEALVPLEERSKGFQWFFSFDMTFMYETQGTFKGCILLLDEPGLHLHAAGQRDLLTRLNAYAQMNQMVYSTHLPFMIDMERLDTIRICVEDPKEGTKVTNNFYTTDRDARFPLQAALGLSMSQSLFVGKFNLVVEGVTDFWFLSTMATILRAENKPTLDERIVITPAGGATKVAYVATMLSGQELNVAVLLDSDSEGKTAADELIKQWIMKDRHVILLGAALGSSTEMCLEDLFPLDYYLSHVNKAYASELGDKPLATADLSALSVPTLVRKVNEVLKARGVPLNAGGMAFNKGRVARRIMEDLAHKKVAELSPDLFQAFEKLFKVLNAAVPGLQSGPDQPG